LFAPAARAAGRLGGFAERGVCTKSRGAMSTVSAVFADFADVYFRERVFGAKNVLPKTAKTAETAKTAPFNFAQGNRRQGNQGFGMTEAGTGAAGDTA